ncbi:MAG TPA: copper chaperone PCu(A)C [Luteimonas sp.]|nr:copper chaperone PCu(A)C [Luteimonas sp.]
MNKKNASWLFGCVLLTLLGACARQTDIAAGDLRIAQPWIRAIPPGAPAAGGFATIRNAGGAPDRLLSASSAQAERVEVHEVQDDGGVMRMRQLRQGLAIPGGSAVELKPGGYHLMLISPKHRFAEGETIEVRLRFERAGEVAVPFGVRSMLDPGTQASGGHAH